MTTALFLKHLTTTKEKKQIHQHKTAEVTKLEKKNYIIKFVQYGEIYLHRPKLFDQLTQRSDKRKYLRSNV